MLSLTPHLLMRCIRSGFEFMENFTIKRAEMIRRFAGPHYRQDNQDAKSPENYPFAYKQFVSPQLLFGVPQCTVRAANSVADAALADAFQLALNAWAKETSVLGTLEEALDDSFFGYGITCVGVEGRGYYRAGGLEAVQGDFESVPNYPYCVRIDPRDFFILPPATNLRRVRMMGHRFERDLDELEGDDTFDQEQVARLHDTPKTSPAPNDAFDNQQYDPTQPEHRRITLYQVYLPEQGRIITVAETGRPQSEGMGADGVILRNERYFGPDEGPYDLWGLDSVPGEAIPISPLVALWDEFLEVNEHSKAASRAAATHKRVGIYGAGSVADAKRVHEARAGEWVAVNDPASFKDVETGGVTESQYRFVQFVRDRFDRNLGFTDAQRGQIKANTTATQAQIANSNSDLRVMKMQERVRGVIASIYRKVAWYFFHDGSIEPMTLEQTDPISGAKIGGTFMPGPWYGGYVAGVWVPPNNPGDWTDYNLEINPKTMGKQDDALLQKRAQDELALVGNLAGMFGPQAINWRRVLNRYGEAMGERDYAEIVLSPAFTPMLGPDMQAAQVMQAGMMQRLPQPAGVGGGVTAGSGAAPVAAMTGNLLGQAHAA